MCSCTFALPIDSVSSARVYGTGYASSQGRARPRGARAVVSVWADTDHASSGISEAERVGSTVVAPRENRWVAGDG